MHVVSTWSPIVVTEILAGGYLGGYFLFKKIWGKIWSAVKPYLITDNTSQTDATSDEESAKIEKEITETKTYVPTSAQKIHLTQQLWGRDVMDGALPNLPESIEGLRGSLETLIEKFDTFRVPHACVPEQNKLRDLFKECLTSTNKNLESSSNPGYFPCYGDDDFYSELQTSMMAINSAHALKSKLPVEWSEQLRPFVREVGDSYKSYFAARKRYRYSAARRDSNLESEVQTHHDLNMSS